MKEIDFNSYIVSCWGLLVLLLVFLNEFQYDEETKNLLIITCGILVFLPFEILCSKIIWFIITKTNFRIKFVYSDRVIRIN